MGRVCSCFFWRDVRQEAFLIRLYDDDNHFRLSAFFILFLYFIFPTDVKKEAAADVMLLSKILVFLGASIGVHFFSQL